MGRRNDSSPLYPSSVRSEPRPCIHTHVHTSTLHPSSPFFTLGPSTSSGPNTRVRKGSTPDRCRDTLSHCSSTYPVPIPSLFLSLHSTSYLSTPLSVSRHRDQYPTGDQVPTGIEGPGRKPTALKSSLLQVDGKKRDHPFHQFQRRFHGSRSGRTHDRNPDISKQLPPGKRFGGEEVLGGCVRRRRIGRYSRNFQP